MADLTTLAKVKAFAATDAGNDALVEVLIDQASKRIESFCRRIISQQASHVEFLRSRGDDAIVLREWPVASPVVVVLDTTLVLDTDYELQHERLLRRISGTAYRAWERNVRIKVTYSAGYSTIPLDIELAANTEVAWLYKQSAFGGDLLGTVAESTPTGTDVSYDSNGLLAITKGLLRPYVRIF